MTNIAFGKIGKSIKLKSSFSPTGGDNEAPNVLKALANNNPDKTFYIVGRSDFKRLTDNDKAEMFPYSNVIDCYEGCGSVTDKPDYLIDWFKEHNVKIDFAVCMIGQMGNVTIPNRVQKMSNPNEMTSIIDMTKNYTTPVLNWLNETDVQWVEIVNDPRYTSKQSRDFIKSPAYSLGQYDYTYTHNRIKSFEDQTRHDVYQKSHYEGMETAFCIGREYPILENISENRPVDFMVVLNEGKPSRYKMLKEWVLDRMENVEIYGQWDEEITKNDHRFKGTLHIDELQKKLRRAKATFIIPIADGWVTSKYIEMIHAGVVPFFHPSYDRQGHINVPDALRLRKPSDLPICIDLLKNDFMTHLRLMQNLQDILDPAYYDGTFMNDKIMSRAYKHILGKEYQRPDINQYTKAEINDLSSFF